MYNCGCNNDRYLQEQYLSRLYVILVYAQMHVDFVV